MAKQYSALEPAHLRFIAEQKIFFVGTATADSRVNVSPKGMDCLRVVGPNRIAWLNITGSGNETAAHVQQLPRMTIMFCSFTGSPLILRVYGAARAIHHNDPEWAATYACFDPIPGARQVFELAIDLVQTSCGQAVPNYDYRGDRKQQRVWCEKLGDQGIRDYWVEANQHSIDGIPTGIIEKNL